MQRISVVGHVCADLTPGLGDVSAIEGGRLREVGPLQVGVGGCVGNVSRVLAGLEHPVLARASVGDDLLGRFIGEALESVGATAELTTTQAGTSYSIVLEPSGRDRAFWHHVGANATFDGAEFDLDGADILHVGYPSLLPALCADDAEPLVALLRRAKSAGATTSLDLAVIDPDSPAGRLDWHSILRRVLPFVDVITPSVDDLTSALRMTEPVGEATAHLLADLLLAWGAGVAVVSAGEAGLVWHAAGVRRLRDGGRALSAVAAEWAGVAAHHPVLPVARAQTTNGAGDAMTAGVLFALSRGAGPAAAAAVARACAALAVAGSPISADSVVARDPLTAAAFGRAPISAIAVPANQPPRRFYRGGEAIARFRGATEADPFTPEDWVGSTVTVRGEGPAGLTTLPDGRVLRDAIAQDAVGWLGEPHVRAFGDDPMLLVKVLDAGQRLPIHAHPDRTFAAREIGSRHGKAEAWYILTPGSIHLGLTQDVSRSTAIDLVREQRVDELLTLMHEVAVQPGDTVYVPPGMLHAIGEGVLLVELQEPEDLSILLEWKGFDIDGSEHGHLGLGFDTALEAVRLARDSPDDIERLVVRASSRPEVLADGAARYFRLEEFDLDGRREIDGGFAIVVGLEGHVELVGEGGAVEVGQGTTAILPAAAGAPALAGRGRVLVARPPLPATGRGA